MGNLFQKICLIIAIFLLISLPSKAQFQNFTYQGSLRSSNLPANGVFDFEFDIYSVPTGGASQASYAREGVQVTNGIFTVALSATTTLFDGETKYLEIGVKPAGEETYQILTPRQQIRYTPYAIKSINADNATSAQNADNAQNLGGVAAADYLTESEANAAFIPNSTPNQPSASFFISGTGTAGIFSASQFSILGNRILHAPGQNNIFAGFTSGIVNSSGASNSFFGSFSGLSNSSGSENSFVGASAGQNNSSGNANSFLGAAAGQGNLTGSNNSFFGSLAGTINTTGNFNTLLGAGANFASNNLTNATAIGSRASVSQNNSLILGSIAGINNATADTRVGIGTTAPGYTLHIVSGVNTGLRVQNNASGGAVASFGGTGAFDIDAGDTPGGRLRVLENGNVGIGATLPSARLHVNGSVRVVSGDVFIQNPNTLVITSPNGACWGITVNNSGQLATFPVNPCP